MSATTTKPVSAPAVPMARTTYTITKSQTLRRSQVAEGQVIAELIHPASIPAQHLIEAMRGGIPSLKVKTEPIAAKKAAATS